MTEMLFPRIARQGAACLILKRGQARETRIEKFDLDEGFQPHHPPFRRDNNNNNKNDTTTTTTTTTTTATANANNNNKYIYIYI